MKIQLNARNRAYTFEAREGERLLYAGLQTGIDLPYECGTGTCGTCKAKLVSGEVEDLWPGAPGKKYLKRESAEFLMCQCTARSDCTVEVGNFVSVLDPGTCVPSSFKGVIRSAARLTHDVLYLKVDLDRPRDFDAGQFVVMAVPGIRGFRGYSMVNFERQARELAFVIKKKPGGGVSEWLFESDRVGVEVKLYGPLGHATFYPSLGKNILCIAGGSGIAGMMSIISRGCQENYFRNYSGYVFFGVRTMRDAFFLRELSEFREKFPDNLHVVVALSEDGVPVSARSEYPLLEFDEGVVHEVAARRMQGRYQNIRAYLAGPPPAVDAAIRMLLLEAKLTTDNIRYDKFS